jgi:hypothetical protein
MLATQAFILPLEPVTLPAEKTVFSSRGVLEKEGLIC